jgi:transcriptional regulator with XRE-family HTH domain
MNFAEFWPQRITTRFAAAVTIRAMPRRSGKKRGRPPTPQRDYPNRLRALRDSRGLTLQQVAADAGMHVKTLARYETGERQLKTRVLERLAAALDVPPAQLLNSVDPVADAQEQELLALFRAASPDGRERLLGAAPSILGAGSATRKTAS